MIKGFVSEIVYCDMTEEEVGELVVPLLLAPVDYADELIDLLADWGERASTLSGELQDRALWRIIGTPIGLDWILRREDVELQTRDRLIRAMRHITESIPLVTPPDAPMEAGYFMLWDCICDGLEVPPLIEACFEVLTDLLRHEDIRVQWSVLHGLGHLDHPRRPEVIATFMEGLDRSEWDEEDWNWMLACREGTVM